MKSLLRLLLAFALLGAGAERVEAATAAETRAFKAARSAFEDAMWDRAEREFDQFIAKNPKCDLVPDAVLFQAQARFKLGRFADAISLLNARLSDAGERTDRYLYWIGESQFQQGEFAAAAETFSRLAREFSSSVRRLEASVGEAAARARLGEWMRVRELLGDTNGVFQKTALTSPGNEWVPRGLFLLSEAGLSANDPAAARAALQPLESAILKPEQTWQRQQLLTRIALSEGHAEQALEQSTNLVLLAGLAGRNDLAAEGSALQGQIYERLDRKDKALEAFGRNLTPTAPAARQVEALGKIAEIHIGMGETDAAMRKLNDFLTRSTNGPAVHVALLTLGELHLKQFVGGNGTNPPASNIPLTNHLELALGFLNRLVTNSPPRELLGRAQLNRGWCFWLSDQPGPSLDAFTQAAAQLAPSEELAVAQFKAGDAAFAMRDFAHARDNYRAALESAAKFPRAQESFGELALYQLERACLALGDAPGAEHAMRLMLDAKPPARLAERSLLLAGQGYSDAGKPERAEELFADFVTRFPDSALRPEVELARARACEQRADWPGALAIYHDWSERYTNHTLLPDVEFYQARASFQSGNETNALNVFTNFLTRHPSHELVPAAEFWLGDHFYRAGDFSEAEKQFKQLYQYWPKSSLALEACMMAGRAAVGRLGYKDAIKHFTNLTLNASCPTPLKIAATFAYGSALMLIEESASTNRLSNLRLAAEVFGTIAKDYPDAPAAAQAWGEVGNCYLQMGDIDPQYYSAAHDAYSNVTASAQAGPAAIGQAKVGLGLVEERTAAAGPPEQTREARHRALDHYLDALYDEAGDPFWRKKAGLEALRLGQSLGEWPQVERLCERLQKLFPPLYASLEKKRVEAQERQRAGK